MCRFIFMTKQEKQDQNKNQSMRMFHKSPIEHVWKFGMRGQQELISIA